MADQSRARRMADRIKVVVAEALERRIKDPRLGFVTITDVRLTGDLHDATVFYTVLGDEAALQESADALKSATGALRTEVGRQLGVRFTPTLSFVPDALPESAGTIDELLKRAHEADEQVHGIAAEAQYAGDADPYRHPADSTADDSGDSTIASESSTA